MRRNIVIWRSGSGDGGRPARVWLDSDVLGYPSAAWSSSPSPARRLQDFGKGYSQSEFFFDLCVNVLVRPTRISPRQSGAAGPRSTLRGCVARPGSSVAYCSPAAPTGPSP